MIIMSSLEEGRGELEQQPEHVAGGLSGFSKKLCNCLEIVKIVTYFVPVQ
jgi:hypothetical protein